MCASVLTSLLMALALVSPAMGDVSCSDRSTCLTIGTCSNRDAQFRSGHLCRYDSRDGVVVAPDGSPHTHTHALTELSVCMGACAAV